LHGISLLRYFGVYFDRFYLLFFLRLLLGAWRLVGAALINLVLTDRVHLLSLMIAFLIECLKRHVLVIDDLGILLVYCQLRRKLIEGYALLSCIARIARQRYSLAAAMTVSVARLQACCRHLPIDVSRDGRSARAAHGPCDVTPVAICCTCCSSFHFDDAFRFYFYVDSDPARCTALFSLVRYSSWDVVALMLTNGVCSGVELWLRLIEREARVKIMDVSRSNNESQFI